KLIRRRVSAPHAANSESGPLKNFTTWEAHLKNISKTPLLVGGALTVGFLVFKILRNPAVKKKLEDAYDEGCTNLDQRVGWSTLQTPGGLLTLVGVRNTLRANNF